MPQESHASGHPAAGPESDEQQLARMMNLTTGPERRAEILDRVMSAGLDHGFARSLIDSNLSLQTVCNRIVDEVARRNAPATINGAHGGFLTTDDRAGSPAQVANDMADALVARYGGPAPTDRARHYQGMRIVDMARHLLELRGVSARHLSRDEVLARAFHSTSDFPYVLENVGGKTLRTAYEAAPLGTKAAAKQVLARDFKPMSRVMVSEAPALQKVLEGGEFKRGKMIDSKETYSVVTFGRIIGITRQALVNDDLGAFTDMGRALGQQAAELERSTITAILTANAAMADGGNLFNATAVSTAGGHANLGTGTGSALGTGALATAIKSMRTQVGVDKVTPINVAPKFLIVPASLEFTALQLVTAVTPNAVSSVNPYAGKFEVVVDPRLDANSTTAWYLAADPAVIDGLEYAYLSDAPGPQIFMQDGWDSDGIEWKIRLDFNAAAVEWRSLYKANGA